MQCVAELKLGWSQALLGRFLTLLVACGVGLHFCPFLRALGQTITMLDHYVNYPEKTKIMTGRQTYLRSRPSNSDMLGKQEDNKTPIVVG